MTQKKWPIFSRSYFQRHNSGRLLLFARCQDRVHLHDDTPKLSPPEWLYLKTTSCDAYTIRTAITSHFLWLKKLLFWIVHFKLSQFILQRYEKFWGVFGICFSWHQHTKEWIKAKVSFDWEMCLFLPCRGGIIYFCLIFLKYEFDFKKVGKVSTFWENRNTLFSHSPNKHYPTSLFMHSSVI